MIKSSFNIAPSVAFSYVLVDVATLNAAESSEERLRLATANVRVLESARL